MLQSGLIWWVGTGALLVAELLTGTFYLLMIALGCAAAGLAYTVGLAGAEQLAIGAAVALAAVVVLRRTRFGRRARRSAVGNRDVNLDIGEILQVAAWHERRARAMYRGAEWDVELVAGESEVAGWYRIREIQGSRLIVVAKRD
jgi:membrane protein implicated in regulation of membrane protease activity